MPGLALFITTYATQPVHTERLRMMLLSLKSTGFAHPIHIIDDGSACLDHIEFLASVRPRFPSLQIFITFRGRNYGIAKTKNYCLRLMIDNNYSSAFLADDDLRFLSPGWSDYYISHYNSTGIEHFSWGYDQNERGMTKIPERVNGGTVVRCSSLNGCLLFVTRNVVKSIGGFPILPHKWGHEHTNWTNRIVKAGFAPFYTDVVNSNSYVLPNAYAWTSTVSLKDKQRFEIENEEEALVLEPVYRPLITK